jgi:sterol desaturase/sphingolipid hydroxylase (fatty acid hydroxylase superfamily)
MQEREDGVMSWEIVVRLGFFFGIFGLVAVWELVAPRRTLSVPKGSRWVSNLGLTFLNPLGLRLLFPMLAVSAAQIVQESGKGILNNLDVAYWMALAIGVIALDLVIYLQHVMFHAVPLLWRLHMVHHADLEYDVTTGLRFHPIEITLSMGIKLAAIVVLAPPVMAVLIFEVILNGTSMFNHGNIRIPTGIDRVLRYFVVTPDMHRVHHSVIIRETNSNFGFNLPWWDRVFGTYRDQPVKGHDGMTIGLGQFRDSGRLTLPWLLVLPFVGDPGRQSINRH